MRERDRRILEVLAAANHELYGLDLVAAKAAKRSWLYVVLSSLEDRGLIEGRAETLSDLLEHPPTYPAEHPYHPRRTYRITAAGRAALLPTAKVR